MPEKNKIEVSDEGEWMSTQMRLLTAGFRTNDRLTLKTAYENIIRRHGEKVAGDILFEIYMENQPERQTSNSAGS